MSQVMSRILECSNLCPGMPDGMFQYKKSQFRYIFEDLGMENVVIFYSHLEKFAAIWYFSLPVNTYVIWSFWYAIGFDGS
jgi:hypothetical protein